MSKKEKPVGYKNPQCTFCGREEDLRFGGCFDCAELQSILIDNTDMDDNDYSDWNMSEKLAFIIKTVQAYEN